jgi:hypothetical protein
MEILDLTIKKWDDMMTWDVTIKTWKIAIFHGQIIYQVYQWVICNGYVELSEGV